MMSTTGFLLTPLREGRRVGKRGKAWIPADFYSRPCGRGDQGAACAYRRAGQGFLLTPLREGRPYLNGRHDVREQFLLTPLREGRPGRTRRNLYAARISTHAPAGGATRGHGRRHIKHSHFYSRPCGRGDGSGSAKQKAGDGFLLTPLREGRLYRRNRDIVDLKFLLTPLREGRHCGYVQQAYV